MDTRPLSPLHLVFGLLFLGLAGVWAMISAGLIHNVRAELVLPLLLIAAGGIGLVTFVATSLRGVRREATVMAAPAAATEPDHAATAPSPDHIDPEESPQESPEESPEESADDSTITDTATETPVTDDTAPITPANPTMEDPK